MTILTAVARELGVDVADLDRPLYDAVDPDALERLLAHGGAVTVSFEYAGHTVEVDGDCSVSVERQSSERGVRR